MRKKNLTCQRHKKNPFQIQITVTNKFKYNKSKTKNGQRYLKSIEWSEMKKKKKIPAENETNWKIAT